MGRYLGGGSAPSPHHKSQGGELRETSVFPPHTLWGKSGPWTLQDCLGYQGGGSTFFTWGHLSTVHLPARRGRAASAVSPLSGTLPTALSQGPRPGPASHRRHFLPCVVFAHLLRLLSPESDRSDPHCILGVHQILTLPALGVLGGPCVSCSGERYPTGAPCGSAPTLPLWPLSWAWREGFQRKAARGFPSSYACGPTCLGGHSVPTSPLLPSAEGAQHQTSLLDFWLRGFAWIRLWT